MKNYPVQIEKYGVQVWSNEMMDELRKTECLCLNCANLRPGTSDNCHKAARMYEISVEENVAMAVTRCEIWREKPKLNE